LDLSRFMPETSRVSISLSRISLSPRRKFVHTPSFLFVADHHLRYLSAA
jgi:hypothetical protein